MSGPSADVAASPSADPEQPAHSAAPPAALPETEDPASRLSHTPAQLFWRDTIFALSSIYLAGMVMWIQWDWRIEALLYAGLITLLRPLVLRHDNTLTLLNVAYAVAFGTLGFFLFPAMFSSGAAQAPALNVVAGWPIWAALPGMWYVVLNGMTYRIKVYRAWHHVLCIPLLISVGIVAMWEVYEVFRERGFGYGLGAQLLFWGLWCIPLLHDRAIHPRARGWS